MEIDRTKKKKKKVMREFKKGVQKMSRGVV
jgi:hypothetical protein